MHLKERVYMVTGAGGAVASQVTAALAAAGAELVLVGRRAGVRAARAAVGHGLEVTADLSRVDEAADAVRAAVESFGRLDGVIHTVGGFEGGKVLEAGPAALQRMLAKNLLTLANVVAAALPELTKSDDAFLGAISAGQAFRGIGPGSAAYTASKAALSAYLRSLDAELAGTSVRIGIVYPMGTIDTAENRAAMPQADPGKWIDGTAVAEALLFMATRSESGRVPEVALYARR
jgi:NADP-dependent 3-hydroxy acid dehydrogenase YdfG